MSKLVKAEIFIWFSFPAFFFFLGKQTERKILGGLGFSTGTNRKGVRRFDRSWTWWGRFSFWCTRHLSLLLSSSSSNQRTQNHNRWIRWPKLESTTILSNPNWQKQFFFFFFLIKRERASARERERERESEGFLDFGWV